MKIKSILKIGAAVGLLFSALTMSTYAASITEVSGKDAANNAFAVSQTELTAYTPLSTTLTVTGKTDKAKMNTTILIEAENTTVYLNQTVSDENGNFSFSFPVALQGGYVYTVKVNTEDNDTASKLYFKTESTAPVHYGDVDGDGSLTTNDASSIYKYLGNAKRISATVKSNIVAGLGDVDGDTSLTTNDASAIYKYLGSAKRISATVKQRLAWTETK